jgi:5-methyltetrahydrofolate--homocysteine methyltransferase
MNEKVQPIFDGIVAGKTRDVLAGIQDALGAGVPVDVIINNGMIAAMSEVGYRFEDGECFVPEMLVSARAMQAGMDAIRPYITEGDIQPAGRVLFGTVSGDLHDIGKNLVSVMLEGAGFVVVDLGKDVSAPEFVKAVREQEPDILALSALLTTTMPNLKVVVEALNEAGIRKGVKVLVGGAPVTQEYADLIGADGYAPNAGRAVTVAKDLMAI